MEKKLTQKRLKEILIYDELFGVFTRKISRGGNKAGSMVGTHNSDGYIIVRVDYKKYPAHKLAFLYMEGYFPEYDIDHKNRIRHDNRWCNLRHVTHICNMRNRGILSTNRSGITGVHWRCAHQRWISQIQINRVTNYIGSFVSFGDAVMARWDAEIKHGFPNCNSTSSAFKWLKEAGIVE